MDEEYKIHRKFAVDLFNETWEFIEKPERTVEEDDAMLYTAYASRYHWAQVGDAVNFARGEWQISRVYAILKRPEGAIYHAGRCLDICLENGIGDFDLAFAYEAMARGFAITGDTAKTSEYLSLASAAGEDIVKNDDKKYFFSEIDTINIGE